jgi:hypothetical protein
MAEHKALPGPGRPSKRTPETEERLFEALRGGCTRRAACAHAGITLQTLLNWEQAAIDGDPDYFDFLDQLTRAEDQAEALFTSVILKAAERDWKAAESWLKRRRRDEWGDNVKQEVSGHLAVTRKAADMDDDELASIAATGSSGTTDAS